MTFRVERAHRAREDLLDIWVGIAVDDANAADRQLRKIEEAINNLRQFPRMGPLREDIYPGVRTILQVPHLIFYRVDEDRKVVEVIRVIDARRDLEAALHQ